MEWDPGPPAAFKALFRRAPLDEYQSAPTFFRLHWGPVWYRGRLNGKARVLVVGQDPSADENIARRVMVGVAGQRAQQFLRKVGIDKSYVVVNASLYSIFNEVVDGATLSTFTDRLKIRTWMNDYLDLIATKSPVEAVIAFGAVARHVLDGWPGIAAFKPARFFHLTHPTAPLAAAAPANWSANLAGVAAQVTADSGVVRDLTPYPGPDFRTEDSVRIPLRDLPFGIPTWVGTGDMAARKDQGTTRAILWTALGDSSD